MLIPYSLLPTFYDIQTYSSSLDVVEGVATLLRNISKLNTPILLCPTKTQLLNGLDMSGINEVTQRQKTIITNALKLIITSKKYLEIDMNNQEKYSCRQNCQYSDCCKNTLKSYDDKVLHTIIGYNECVYSELDNVLLIEEFLESDFYNKIVKSNFFTKSGDGLQNIKSALIPIFRYSKRIIIYDRYIGQCLDNKPIGFPNFTSQYEKTLTEFISLINTYSLLNPEVYIIGGLTENTINNLSQHSVKQNFNRVFSRLNTKNFTLKFLLKRVDKLNDIDHDRFIISDKITVKFHNGLDFIDSNNLIIKDTEISVSEPKLAVEELVNEKKVKNFHSYSN